MVCKLEKCCRYLILDKVIFFQYLSYSLKSFFFYAVNVPCLPTSPTSLSIINCEVVNVPSNKSYFWELDKRMPSLEKLDLSYNNWLTNHSLYSLCKFKKLKEISFRGCMRIGDTACYTMIATNFGFKNVQKLDLRDTSVGDHELSCFTKLPKVKC